MEGARVMGVLIARRCQKALYAAGFGKEAMVRLWCVQDGGEFGMPGALTAMAVKAFQKARGMEVTGSFDAPTRAALGVSPTDA